MNNILNGIYEHLRVLGTHCGSLDRLHRESSFQLHLAMHEIKRLESEVQRMRDGVSFQRDDNDLLRAEVRRLRLTPSEREALIDASLELQALHCMETDHSATLRNLLARQGGEV